MKLPIQAQPVFRQNLGSVTNAGTSGRVYPSTNPHFTDGVVPSIVAPPLDFCAGSNSPMCQMWRSGQLRF